MIHSISLISHRFLLPALTLVVLGMLYVGLRDNIPNTNQVSISASNGALVFGERALAYSSQNLNEKHIERLNSEGFEVALDFSPVSYETNSFQFLLLLSNGNASEQLLIAQFRDHIIVMNGDDYNHSKKTPRISIQIKDRFKGFQQFRLKVENQATYLYLAGQKRVKKSTQIVKIPDTKTGVRLLLSGSELLENNWRGAINSLTIKGLNEDNSLPLVLFQGKPSTAGVHTNSSLDWLQIPEKLSLLKHRVLEASSFKVNSKSALHDMLINFFGFIPFGVLFSILLLKFPIQFTKYSHQCLFLLLTTFLCSFLFSFIIEYRQAWLVTRHSSLRDLYLNAAGGVSGSFLVLIAIKYRFSKET
jgi:VanZ family protein